VAVTRHSKNAASIDRRTFVTGHSSVIGGAAVREQLVAPKVIGCTRPK
jgi:hypothetical protein